MRLAAKLVGSFAALLSLASAPALAQNGLPRKPPALADDFSIPDKPGTRIDTDTEHIFGFGEGTNTQQQGEREISVDSITRFNRRRLLGAPLRPAASARADDDDDDDDDAPGAGAPAGAARPGVPPGRPRFRALGTKLGYQYGATDDFSIELGLFGNARAVRNLADVPNKSLAAFDGGSLEFKYRLIERTAENPFGLAVLAEPRYGRVDDGEGRGVDSFSGETQLLFDARLVDDRLWFASNLGFEPQISRLRGTGVVGRESTFSWSNALAMRLFDNAFVGAEVRYLRAFEGAFLNRFAADAVFAGPMLNVRLSKSAFVTAAFSMRLTGVERAPPPGEIAAARFENYVVRVKVGAEF